MKPVPARVRPLHGLALLTVIMATATGIGLGLGGGGRVTSQEPSGLRVERRSPDDGDTEVTTDAALLVQFNASVQRLAPNETLSPDVLRIDPGPAGVGAWLTSSMYRFRPADGWQPSTRYTVTVAPGLKDVEGRPLAGPESWSFTTVYPAVADVTPGPDTNQAPVAPVPGREPPPPGATPQPSAAPVNGAITVRFNQPVERAAAQAALRFTPPISGAFSWNDDRTLVLQPSAPLAVATKYEGVVAEGVPSAVNPAAVSAAPFTWSFTTAGPAGVSGSEPTALSVTPLGGTVRLTFATPMDKATVDERISVEPKPDNGPFTFFEPGETRLHINFPSKPSTQYTVTLAAGATDRFGQTIDEPFSLTFTTAALRPALTVLGAGRGGAFLAGGQSRVVLSGVNLPAADITLYRIDRAQFQSQLNFGSIRLTPPDGAAEQRRQRVAFPDPELNRTRFATVDLTDAGPLPAGYYLLWATGGEGPPQQLPFVVTGAHLTLKRSADELLVWALDYTTGAPLAGLTLRSLDRNDGEVGSGATDENGLVTLPAPVWEPSRGPDIVNVIGDRDGDTVFGSTAWNAGGGYPYQRQLLGSVTTERPIYRPGETVYYQGVLRRDDGDRLVVPPSDPDATLVAQDARGRELLRRPVQLDEFGAFHGDLALDAEAPAGPYFMRLDLGRGVGGAAFSSFQVASFRRPEFAVTVAAARTDYDNGEQIAVTAGAELFLGAPLPDSAVRWRVTTTPLFFAPPGLPGYAFNDPDVRPTRAVFGARLEGRGRTDARGAFTFNVPADVSGDATSQTFTIETTVIDADNQEVSASTRVRVHKAARYAGVRPRQYVARAGQPATVDLITTDRDGKPAGGLPLTVTVVERRYMTVKVRDADGEERYESQPEDRVMETRAVTTGGDGRADLTFTPPTGGLYRIAVTGRDAAGNEFRSASAIYVTAAAFVPWQVTNDERLQLVADRTGYQPGDVARVLVPAPFAGAIGLVTVERQGVIAREVRTFTGNSEVLEVPIAATYLPNVFVSVALFKAPGPDNPIPEFRSGFVELEVSAESQRLNISLTADRERLGPRESVTFTVKTTDAAGNGVPAELSLALVDEAVLSLTDDRPQDAFAALYGRRPLGVQTSATNAVSLDRVADRARGLIDGSGKGGGGGEEDARSDFRFTAHWEPALRTDAAGNATLTVRLPDTLTTWRLTARGITRASQAGMAETKVQSSRPLIVRPVTPRFFTAGDRPELGAIVNNLTDAPQDVRLSLTADGLTLDGDTARTVRVEPGKQGLVSWRAAVPAEGTARLRWSAAAGGGLSDAVELTRPVHALATPEVAVSAGAVSDRAVEVVRAPAAGASGDVTLELWPSLTATLPQTVRYLREFPYECVEQTSSRMLSALGLAAARGTPADASDITRWVQRLYSQQHPDGGWGWWAADPSDPQMSAYAVTALVAARTAGHSVDANVLERAGAYLRGELERPRDAAAPMNPNLRAFLIYALTGLNGDGISRAVALAERRATLGPEGKALVALALQRGQQDRSDPRLRALLTDLRSSAMLSAGSARWDDPVSAPGRLTTATRTTAFALWALAQADPRDPLVDGAVRWLMNERREGRWSSTQDSALVVLALGAVAQAREEGAAYSYRVTLNDRALREERVERPAVADPTTLAIRGELVGGDNRLVLTRDPGDAPGRLYYQVAYRVFAPAQGIGAQDRGIAVAREFLSPDDDRSLTRVRAGDLVKVRVTVLASGTLNYVAVEDFLPAGLEAVDASLRTTTQEIAQRQRAEAERQAKLRGAACRIAFRSCYSPFTHADIRDDRVALFAQSMPKGAHEYVYFARATAAGTYQVRPSVVSELYFPDVRGRSDSGTFVVEP